MAGRLFKPTIRGQNRFLRRQGVLPKPARVRTRDRIPPRRWNIVQGDLVQVMQGRDAGTQGIVREVVRAQNAVVVEGTRLRTRFSKPTANRPGRMYKVEALIHVSNVALVDPATKRPSKVHRRYLDDGQKVRIASKFGSVLPKPDLQAVLKAKQAKKKFNKITDTAMADVLQVTYVPPPQPTVLPSGSQGDDLQLGEPRRGATASV